MRLIQATTDDIISSFAFLAGNRFNKTCNMDTEMKLYKRVIFTVSLYRCQLFYMYYRIEVVITQTILFNK